MIEKIQVINHLGNSLDLPLQDYSESGLAITNVKGVDPGAANISTSDIASSDGAIFNSARLSTRNVVITFRPMGLSAEATREKVYTYFPIKRKITLVFYTDRRTCYIEGYVEEVASTIFGTPPQISVSVLCPYPYFYSLNDSLTKFSGVDDNFEFPFSIEASGIEIGAIRNRLSNNVFYTGDAEIGFTMVMSANGTVVNPMVYNTDTGERFLIDTTKLAALTGKGFVNKDVITISTLKGAKYINLLREGVTYNILNCVDKNTNWFELHTGDNVFGYTADSGSEFLQFEITNSVLYEGI